MFYDMCDDLVGPQSITLGWASFTFIKHKCIIFIYVSDLFKRDYSLLSHAYTTETQLIGNSINLNLRMCNNAF